MVVGAGVLLTDMKCFISSRFPASIIGRLWTEVVVSFGAVSFGVMIIDLCCLGDCCTGSSGCGCSGGSCGWFSHCKLCLAV